MSDKLDNEALTKRLVSIVEQAREHVSRSVNTAMVHAYWLMGREIVESDQAGRTRADYGEVLMRAVAKNLQSQFGRGFSYSNVKRMRQFYLTYPEGSPAIADGKGATASSLLPPVQKGATLSRLFTSESTRFPSAMSWSHYCLLMRIDSKPARSFYEIEAVQGAWSVRELERQIGSMLYERLTKSRDEAAVKALSSQGLIIEKPADAIKDPMVLEFLGLEERTHWHERDLEQAIIDRLETFLLELGKGFCFVGRQKRLTVDGDHFYVDLVFYNRLLRCFILIDLKLGKLTHQDLGQMQMYVNYFDQFEREESDAPTAGIVLCSDKNDAMVKITLPESDPAVHAARYQLYLPTESELKKELTKERAAAEVALQTASDDSA
ncbi:PDDEXK nuclease domain-containing protein [Granulosicoccus antarcticus]|uniref:Nuclease YhcG n=1 Tax=Granulosicoccus antarcticus IMCC3135 TaxID=1192854 RepID=A0A2Z2NTQ4_9GAMM|nr:PDDEXK nuclease domain-containing protein [Granulosicoccus antarcticus]ASJ73431.1 hypothetical protein IMCC3135_16745 [Granulosicoccus antarcticus IMCC3135]